MRSLSKKQNIISHIESWLIEFDAYEFKREKMLYCGRKELQKLTCYQLEIILALIETARGSGYKEGFNFGRDVS